MDQVNRVLDLVDYNLEQILTNPWVAAFFSIFLILYSSFFAPQLPPTIAKLFDYKLFKVFIWVLILLVYKYNPTVAVMLLIALFLSMQTLSKHKFEGVAKYYTQMKSKMKNLVGNDEHEETKQPVQVNQLNQDLDFDSIASESQVSGLASRTSFYDGPQGMKHPVGYSGPIQGADLF